MESAEELIEDIRKRGWARPTVEIANEVLSGLEGGGPQTFTTRALLETLIQAAEYWEAAQRKAFEDYLEVKNAGWPDEFRSQEAPEGT